MQPTAFPGAILSAIVGRLDTAGDLPTTGPGGIGEWALALTSFLALLAVGGAAARVSHRLMHRSTPELAMLLDQSAAFYGRWPEDQLTRAPRGELFAEARRCRRIIELLEARNPADDGPATRGPIDGLRQWTALLYKGIEGHADTSPGTTYA